jgi:hypothetical protein
MVRVRSENQCSGIDAREALAADVAAEVDLRGEDLRRGGYGHKQREEQPS